MNTNTYTAPEHHDLINNPHREHGPSLRHQTRPMPTTCDRCAANAYEAWKGERAAA